MKVLTILLALLLASSITAAAQESRTDSNNQPKASSTITGEKKKRGPIFRANKDQIRQAQAILKQRGFYDGEQTGKLDDGTRAGLRKFQEAEGIKVTGTLNRLTLEKMSIALTDKQRSI
ncbi:MAG TPA: peptidoglycan-binding domain-containing protein [Pyrinomonadaceae bacterium]|nr:peptidoglycan-binding domain-containing protein [Pyrinomonadaceae bacterium]